MTFGNIVTAIRANKQTKRPILVAIEGYGGSGKTTLAEQLSNALGVAWVVHMDDFIVKERMNDSSWEAGFNRDRLERQVLIPATRGQSIHYQKLIWESDELSEPSSIPDVDYLIIEGISSYHPSLSEYYDFKIWVHTPIQIAKERGMRRDSENENVEMWDRWAANDLAYQEQYHPERESDFTVNGV